MKGKNVCPNCGAENIRLIGYCRVCLSTVCSSCGNKQKALEDGEVAVHSRCLVENLNRFESSFKFVKLKKKKF